MAASEHQRWDRLTRRLVRCHKSPLSLTRRAAGQHFDGFNLEVTALSGAFRKGDDILVTAVGKPKGATRPVFCQQHFTGPSAATWEREETTYNGLITKQEREMLERGEECVKEELWDIPAWSHHRC
ncbi:Hypothetical predicted protein [Xyrichtys novacula]|uniref:Uncharacterized protein n=1 Tax=Xyrichtys novacula TaxID=13765 RepID=A0AAV1FY28_XYRNO|nr:Hypothetical predicted protein [Xyrichtys novacula]